MVRVIVSIIVGIWVGAAVIPHGSPEPDTKVVTKVKRVEVPGLTKTVTKVTYPESCMQAGAAATNLRMAAGRFDAGSTELLELIKQGNVAVGLDDPAMRIEVHNQTVRLQDKTLGALLAMDKAQTDYDEFFENCERELNE